MTSCVEEVMVYMYVRTLVVVLKSWFVLFHFLSDYSQCSFIWSLWGFSKVNRSGGHGIGSALIQL